MNIGPRLLAWAVLIPVAWLFPAVSRSQETAVGGQFQVNTYTTSGQRSASVASDETGDFVVVWESYGSDGGDTSSFSIQGQRYDASGSPLGGQFQVNTYTTDRQYFASVASDEIGDFVVVWESDGSDGGDTSSFSIQGQRHRVPIFTDGFESGSTSSWSAVVP